MVLGMGPLLWWGSEHVLVAGEQDGVLVLCVCWLLVLR